MDYGLHLTSSRLLLLVLVLLLLLFSSGLCLPLFQRLFHLLGRFVGFAVIIHGYLRFVLFRHGFDLSRPLLLVRVPFVEAWAVLLFVHTDIGIEGLPLFIDQLADTKRILRNQLKRTLQIGDMVTGDTLLAYFEKILSSEDNLLSDIGRHSKSGCFYLKQESQMIYLNDPRNVSLIESTKLYQAIDKLEVDSEFISWITKFLYIQLIDDILSNRVQNEHIAPAINKLNSLSRDFSKVIEVPTKNCSTDLWKKGKPMVVINLDKVNTTMKKLLPLLLSMMCYQEHKGYKKEGAGTRSLNIIIDEAHNILSYESSRESESWKDFRLETFEEIIKEGRKFGVFLTLASQRPSDISSTIISQLHNYLIHRLVNNRDLEMVEKAISYLDKLSVETLPILPAGACVLSGIVADLPILVQIDELNEEDAPKSQTIKLTNAWLDSTSLLQDDKERGQL